MALVNYSLMRLAAKIVYYGPGLGGKTTNLRYIHANTTEASRGEMVSLDTAADRTLYFDLLPLEVGTVAGFSTRLQLYTVPGQVYYNTTRQLVLKGVDGVVFVADSRRSMLTASAESLANLRLNLEQQGESIPDMPVVLQYNKRDLDDVCTVDELNESLNPDRLPWFEASAIRGEGVFETLTEITRLTLLRLKERLREEPRPIAVAVAAAQPPLVAVPAAPGPTLAAPSPPLAVPGPPPAAPRSTAAPSSDPLAELERLRSEVLGGTSKVAKNGHDTIQRTLRVALTPEQLRRAERLSLKLVVEDGQRQAVDTPLDLEIDIDQRPSLEEILLRFNIQVSSR